MSCFSKVFEKSDEFNSLAGSINISGAAVGATGVSDAVKAHMIHSLIQEKKAKKAVIIMPDEASAVRMSEKFGRRAGRRAFLPRARIHFSACGGSQQGF
ncbi:MAG: hypothetical protein L6V88_10930 [Anaerotruncus sp.]|nr:MAG: hypothetical protein L6V88_10930 [Anaerotruncus sp.]